MYEVQKRCEYTFIRYNTLFLIVQFKAQGWLPALCLEISEFYFSTENFTYDVPSYSRWYH